MVIFQFTEKNAPQQLTEVTALPDNGFLWINCTPSELEAGTTLANKLTGITLNDRHIDDCLNPNHPCFFDSMQDYDLLIFRNLNFPPAQGYTDTHPVVFILFDLLLLTVSEQDDSVRKVQQRIFESGRRQPAQPEVLLHLLLNTIVDNFLALRAPLTEQFSQWQNKLLNKRHANMDWTALLNFKTKIHLFGILCEEQQDALGKWRQNMEEDLTQAMAVRLNDLSNHIFRVMRFTRALESELEALMQLHYALLGERTNEVMRILTVISAIFLPLTLITNTFGMNFHDMPGLSNPHGLYYILAIMAISVVGLLSLFKWKRWI